MPSKKKKYNARFPAGRIKKIMQSDEEVGKVAQAVPVIISRTLELFVESLLTKTLKITNSRNAKTLSPSHMKQCIMSENRFDFLRELVKYIPDISIAEESGQDSSPGPPTDNTHGALDYRLPSTSSEANMSPINGVPLTGNGTTDSIKDYSNSNFASHSKTEQKRSLKRQWEGDDNLRNFNKSLRSLRSKENTVSSQSTQSLESSPPKLSRMDSAPVASLDLSKDSKKRLMHQSKSVPCASKEEHPPLPAVPAPIVDISICNKPIVKIDYSNLILPEKDSSSGSSSDQNSSNTCISPVIKIDLSKITTQPRSNLQAISMSTTSVKSSFELDEDYDNI